jgi:CheY-like chemotaxis protein
MKKKLNTIVLLDDNEATNFIHKKFIDRAECANHVYDFQSGINLLEYLADESNPLPEIIFVDINMPIMSSWEFLENYKDIQRPGIQDIVIILLSTSLSPTDTEKAESIELIKDIQIKPLTVTTIHSVIKRFFPHLN